MNTTPTCLFINNSPQPGRSHLAKLGGGGMSLLGLLSRLPDYHWRAHVVVPGEGQFTDAVRRMGVPVEVFPFEPISAARPLRSLFHTLRWLRLFRVVRPRIIHANGFELSRSFSLAAGLSGNPYVTHVRFPVDEGGVRWTLREQPKPAAFIFNSQAMYHAMWPMLAPITPHSRSYVVHNAVDTKSFSPAPRPDSPPLRVGIIANFAPIKRHEDFLNIAAEMLKARNDLEFWIIGDDTEGSGRDALLKNMARNLGVDRHVQFLGHRSDVPELLRQLHLLMVTSSFESFGRVLIEAMATGRPVIGTNVGGIPEIINDGETGFLHEVGDVVRFARSALDILGDQVLWSRISEQAALAAAARFSVEAHVAAIVGIYSEVLGPNSF